MSSIGEDGTGTALDMSAVTETRAVPEESAASGAGAPAAEPVGAVVVCGAGITGIQASLDLAESGFKVYLVESSPAIGGRMAQLDKTFPTGDCAMCILSPKLVECARNKNIEIITMADVQGISGEPGNFKVRLRQSPRYVDLVKCNACGDCVEACPVDLPNEFDRRLGTRKAIFRPYPQAIPNVFGISKAPGRAPCKASCPAGVNAQGYVALIAAGKFREAYDLVLETCPFPAACGRVCPHPCETACTRASVDEPISISALKRAAVDHGAPEVPPEKLPVLYEEKVAIIGGGPTGLSCARDLAQYGYATTVFEALPVAGGMLRVGIPDHRMPQDILQHEIDNICALGVDLRLNQRCGVDFTVDGLLDQGYKAVFLAPGLHTSAPAPANGDDLDGCLRAVEFLRELNLGRPLPVGDRVVVIGGGDVAFDTARSALRLTSVNGKSPEVTVAYRRTKEEMPATREETGEGLAEGVWIEYLAAPVEVLGSGGKVTAMKFQRCRPGEPDAKGRRRPEPIPGAFFEIPCDTVIFAVGQAIVTDFARDLGDVTIEDGRIKTAATLATGRPGVFAGGDAAPQGPLTAVNAIAAGRKGAASIHNYLRGKQLVPLEPDPMPEARPDEDELTRIPHATRERQPEQPGAVRRRNWGEVLEGFSIEQAVAEAQRCLACGLCSECMQCVKACTAGAVCHDQRPQEIELDAGSVILTPGFEEFQGSLRGEFGLGRYANVLSSVQFERMLSAAGPTGGEVKRLSDGGEVKRMAFIQCVGSRDKARGNGYCSSICCMSATKEAMVALEHAHGRDLEVSIFCMDVRAFGKEFDAYVNRARDENGVKYVRAIPSRVVEMPGSKNPRVRYFDESGVEQQPEFDLVVLSVGLTVPESVRNTAAALGLDLNEFGFAQTDRLSPMATSRPGLYVAGAFQEPKDIPESVAQASAAAGCAMDQLAQARGTLIKSHDYPWERDVTDEVPRVGVFVCHCGHNIASVIDVEKVAEEAAAMPNVCHAETSIYTCSDTNQQHILDMIREHRLNRLVVASCSPRTHEALFQETLRESGLNQYLFAMANIRDQGSWVHRDDPVAATEKASDLMAMAVARARHLRALQTGRLPVTASALVLGGGLAGMTAALSIADQGFQVHLVEKEAELGGMLRTVKSTLEGSNVQDYRADLVARVEAHPSINLYLRATAKHVGGHVGNFSSILDVDGREVPVNHGVIILATGGQERPTGLYLHGSNPHVTTQSKLEAALENGGLPAELESKKNPTVVMIQCVESRNAEHPYCSRVCCAEAVKNALEIKRRVPGANVAILGRDIRTYGFRELAYQQAREQGVLFVRHAEGADPAVTDEGGRLQVRVHDLSGHRDLLLQPDLLVLSVGIGPAETNPVLSGQLRTALTSDGFFLEAHPKLRPVDLANEGEFLCGVAHSPRFIDETIAQAQATAARAATVLSKTFLEIPGQVAVVDPDNCVACATCVKVCPYGAPVINELGKAEIQGATCMGCGTCAASCPARTITLQHQEAEAVVAMLDELLVGGPST
jgi:heterodisulfide reductase subunit A-like polyferredoxin